MPDSIKNSEGIRVLNANSDESGNAGILIGKTDSSIDMTGMYARITLSVLSKDTSAADVSVILGSTEARAEFFTSVDCNTSVSILCDMTEYTGAGKIDYASVIVRGVPDACAQIQKIELCSDSLTEEQLVQKYESVEEAGHSPLIYALIAIAGAVTVIVFILLMKKQHPKDKDDRK